MDCAENYINHIDEYNQMLAKTHPEHYEKAKKKQGLMIGLMMKKQKQAIPHQTRMQVWKRHFTTFVGKCLVCEESIEFGSKLPSYHCAHYVSEFHGGSNDISNLFPSCGVCNQKMGLRDAPEYYKNVYGKEFPKTW